MFETTRENINDKIFFYGFEGRKAPKIHKYSSYYCGVLVNRYSLLMVCTQAVLKLHRECRI